MTISFIYTVNIDIDEIVDIIEDSKDYGDGLSIDEAIDIYLSGFEYYNQIPDNRKTEIYVQVKKALDK